MRQKEETNLQANLVVIFEVEVGTGELGLDDPPEPVHWRTKRDVRGIGWTRSSSEEGNKVARGVNNDRPRVPTPGERTRVAVIGMDCYFY
jgi:hypothetical protein